MNIRKSIYTLSDTQLQDFKDALNAAKADGSYDDFITRHHHSMMTATLSVGESGDSNTRNVAHRGPAFLPWHRYFCRELELVLQQKRPLVTLPYWDWVADAGNPLGAALWNTNPAQRIYIGGDGTGPNGEVTTGPFAGWTALISNSSGMLVPRPGGIIRELGSNPNFGSGIGIPAFPSAAQVTDAIQNFATYDVSPWHRGSVDSFRNRLEGWRALTGENGSQLHNRGDGIELARTTLNSGAAAFNGQALVVLTDGLENQPKFLSQVGGSIDSRTFAVGLGAAHQVSAEALATIANDTGGYILLTGPLTPDTNSYFLLSKYFQQVLVSATNENIVTDPSGFIAPGQTVRVPFNIADTEIDATVVLLVDVPAVRLSLQAPDGTSLSESQLAALGAPVQHGTNMSFCRVPLPLPVGAGAHGGTWHAVLEVDKDVLKREMTRLARLAEQDRHIRLALERLQAHGPRYAVTVSTWSNLRMEARATQTSFSPGALLRVSAVLTEFGLPVERVRVEADIVSPDGLHMRVPLPAHAPGAFAAELPAVVAGVWRVHVRARGLSRTGLPFTREQLLTAVIVSGRRPPQPPAGGTDRDTLECVLRCLFEEPGVKRWLKERGIDGKRLSACLDQCRTADDKELDRLG